MLRTCLRISSMLATCLCLVLWLVGSASASSPDRRWSDHARAGEGSSTVMAGAKCQLRARIDVRRRSIPIVWGAAWTSCVPGYGMVVNIVLERNGREVRRNMYLCARGSHCAGSSGSVRVRPGNTYCVRAMIRVGYNGGWIQKKSDCEVY